MKIRKLLLSLCLPISLVANSDIIVKKDGTTLEVFNVEIGSKYISFTKETSPDSDLGRILKEECFAIKTADGEMKTIENSSETDTPPTQVQKTESSFSVKDAIAASDNQKIIDSYNSATVTLNKYKEDPKKLHSGFSLTVWGIGNESIMSDENITVGIEPIETTAKKNGLYQFTVYNKTADNVYVDLTNSFKINGKGIARPFYDPTVYSTSHGNNSGGSLNLGAVTGALGMGGAVGRLASGISVGSGSSNVTQVTKADQPILIIPPYGKVALPFEKVVNGSNVSELAEVFYFAGSYYDFIDSYAPYAWGKRDYEDDGNSNIDSESIQLHKNGIVHFDQDKSPKTYRYQISYSTNPEFSQVNRTSFSVYLRGIYGFKPASKSSTFSSTLRQIVMDAPAEFIWGFGSIERGNDPNSKESKKALKESLKGL